MKTQFSRLAVLAVISAATAASAQTVVVPAPAVREVVVPAPAAAVAVPAPAVDSTTTVKRVTVIPAPVAVPTGAPLAPMTSKTTTTTATTTINGVTVSDGVVDVYEPGTRFVVRESTGPVSYSYGPQTVYATPAGVALTAEQVRTRMRAGLPVRVEYLTEGQSRVIQRVVIDDRYLKND